MTRKIELLRQTDARIAGVYAARSGHPAGEFESLMSENNGNGRWLSPEEALAAGLADRIIDPADDSGKSLVGNLSEGWKRMIARIGRKKRQEPEPDRNVLHFDGEGPQSLLHSTIAAEEARNRALPSRTRPCEDPSYGDTIRSANERAYAEDARRFRKYE